MGQPKFSYNDFVQIIPDITVWWIGPGNRFLVSEPRIGEGASVFAVETDRRPPSWDKFPAGAIYGIEFNDGDSIYVHEDDLEFAGRS